LRPGTIARPNPDNRCNDGRIKPKPPEKAVCRNCPTGTDDGRAKHIRRGWNRMKKYVVQLRLRYVPDWEEVSYSINEKVIMADNSYNAALRGLKELFSTYRNFLSHLRTDIKVTEIHKKNSKKYFATIEDSCSPYVEDFIRINPRK
jgi:hypothetical protein